MPSPFPGMNPYIEHALVWKDFHDSLIFTIREILTPQVRPKYSVKISEFVYIADPSTEDRGALGWPDVAILPKHGSSTQDGITALAAPASVGLPIIIEDERVPFLEIWDRRSREVVTAIEVLSPSNKARGADRSQYLAKVRDILSSPSNFVELDLLRGGPRMPWPRMPSCDYCVVVSRHEERQQEEPCAGVWAFGVRDPMPEVPIPLLPGDPNARLHLKTALDRVYDSAAYSDYIYEEDPEPPLREADQTWAEAILSSSGKSV